MKQAKKMGYQHLLIVACHVQVLALSGFVSQLLVLLSFRSTLEAQCNSGGSLVSFL